jgi:hypothetical protein
MVARRWWVMLLALGLNLNLAAFGPIPEEEPGGGLCTDLNGVRCWVNCEDANQQQNGGCPDQPHPSNEAPRCLEWVRGVAR